MATTDTEVQNLIVNKLTLDQYKTAKTAGTLSAIEAYEITDIDTAIDAKSLPSQAGNSGKYLTTNGTNPSWATVSGSGGTWGTITGTLSDQTDLQTALDDKLDTTQITNCITEIPQDIKLELNNGTLTLKAGSKVYALDGSYNSINSDTSIANTWGSASKGIVFYNLGAAYNYYPFERLHSGSTNPTGLTGNSHINYNTTDNKFYQTTNAGSSWSAISRRLPIACVTWDANNKITSIDQVFNGFGYIGSTVFTLPGVKGLIPNGRNADGSLKNTEFSITAVKTATYTTDGNYYIRVGNNYINFFTASTYYDKKQNFVIYNNNIQTQIMAGNLTISSGKITSFNPKTVFHAVDYGDFSDLKDTVDTIDSNAVHKTGNETIAGVKIFTNNMATNDIYAKGNITLGTSTNTWGKMVQFQDTTGKRIARIQPMAIDTTNNRIGMWVNNADNSVEKGMYIDSNGVTTVPTPTTTTATDSLQIATTGWVNKVGNNVVHKTGDETVAGLKTYTNRYLQKNTALTKGTLPASANWWSNEYTDKNGSGLNNRLACMEYAISTNGDAYTHLRTYKYASNNSDNATLSIVYPITGNPYATAPTPTTTTSTDSTQIATTGWVNSTSNNVVHKTGDESIAGIKTFENTDLIQKTTNAAAGSYTDFKQYIKGDRRGTIRTTYNSDGSYQIMLACNGPNASAPDGIYVRRDSTSTWTGAPTPATSDNSTKIATTAYVNNKHQVVSTLPASPDANVFYYIPE